MFFGDVVAALTNMRRGAGPDARMAQTSGNVFF